MKAEWKLKRLAEVCTLQRGFDLPTQDRKSGDTPLVSSSGVVDRIDQSKVKGPGVVTGRSGSIGNVFWVEEDFWPLNTALYVKDFFGNDERFVFLLLQSLDLARFASGTGVPTLNRNHVSDEMVLIPDSLEEQRWIVAVMDEAFAAIATATTNAEKNLANARELFSGELRQFFSSAGSSWTWKPLGEVAHARLGKMLDKQKNTGELFPYLRNLNVRWFGFDLADMLEMPFEKAEESKYSALKGDLMIVEGGYPGRCAIWEADEPVYFQKAVHRVRFDDPRLAKILMYLLFARHGDGSLKQHFTGSGIQHLTGKSLAKILMPLPPTRERDAIVAKIEALLSLSQNSQRVYRNKIRKLSALKRSLLHCGFTGKLAGPEATASVQANDNFATPEFAAQVLAFAFCRHERQQSQRTFGHVKAQKTLQLVESIGGIDLGRHPIKDAAGPNDFQHMLRATDWAVRNGFFEFVPRANGNGYDFRKLAHFASMMTDALAATRPVSAALERAIDPIVPMVSQDAEVFATVHAAWNNLLHDRKAASDDAIVKEARDEWHSAKLKIPEAKFRAAIKTIRAKGLVPDGTAKYVGGQGGLF